MHDVSKQEVPARATPVPDQFGRPKHLLLSQVVEEEIVVAVVVVVVVVLTTL